MNESNDDFAELNRSFDELLTESDEAEPFAYDEAAVQNLILPVESDSSENENNHDESDHDEEETWPEDVVIHDRFTFDMECGPPIDVQRSKFSRQRWLSTVFDSHFCLLNLDLWTFLPAKPHNNRDEQV
ncbi:hypothetical protein RB195_013957 [Necator americanus]|uniref:PiggyBac transposable element-derived protein domain-containing protein n=1 Tax=Necator americanus TaxID=51031 RepID=A0ABR1DXZ9_NECAM